MLKVFRPQDSPAGGDDPEQSSFLSSCGAGVNRRCWRRWLNLQVRVLRFNCVDKVRPLKHKHNQRINLFTTVGLDSGLKSSSEVVPSEVSSSALR